MIFEGDHGSDLEGFSCHPCESDPISALSRSSRDADEPLEHDNDHSREFFTLFLQSPSSPTSASVPQMNLTELTAVLGKKLSKVSGGSVLMALRFMGGRFVRRREHTASPNPAHPTRLCRLSGRRRVGKTAGAAPENGRSDCGGRNGDGGAFNHHGPWSHRPGPEKHQKMHHKEIEREKTVSCRDSEVPKKSAHSRHGSDQTVLIVCAHKRGR